MHLRQWNVVKSQASNKFYLIAKNPKMLGKLAKTFKPSCIT